ncbi:MAG: hypothetical protein Q8N81_03360 [bacterium]|nr:hypothetical protein [bacterium]
MRDLIRFVLHDRWTRAFLIAFAIVEPIYWTSPEWAQKAGFPTEVGQQVKRVEACTELLAKNCEPRVETKVEVVHDGGSPIPAEGLPQWTPIRVEERFESGLAVVSVLNPGPHGDFQFVVRDLALPKGVVFRVMGNRLIRI